MDEQSERIAQTVRNASKATEKFAATLYRATWVLAIAMGVLVLLTAILWLTWLFTG